MGRSTGNRINGETISVMDSNSAKHFITEIIYSLIEFLWLQIQNNKELNEDLGNTF